MAATAQAQAEATKAAQRAGPREQFVTVRAMLGQECSALCYRVVDRWRS
jgi:hypothetical protein